MRVVVAGSSGFLGTALRDRLAREGHEVLRLVRGEAGTPTESSWDPYAGRIDDDLVASADAVVNLAGAPIARWPWTDSYKRTLLDSRVRTTRVLAEAIARTGGDTALVNGSGIDAYGDTGAALCDESAAYGSTFLADVVRQWEAATVPAVDAGARVVRLRTAAVLHGSGGVLGLIKIPFLLGLGGRAGSGRQWFPVIGREDWVSAVVFLLTRPGPSGPFNLVTPEPVTNAEFARTLGELLRRPTVVPLPAAPLRLVAGELSRQLLGSVGAVPHALTEAGFAFEHPDVRSTLQAAFDRR